MMRAAVVAILALCLAGHAARAGDAEEHVRGVALSLVDALREGRADDAAALFKDGAEIVSGFPDEVPFSGRFKDGSAFAAAAVEWYGDANMDVDKFVRSVVRADATRRTATAVVELEGTVLRSGSDLKSRDSFQITLSADRRGIARLRVTTANAKALAHAHRIRGERLFFEFFELFHQKGPGKAVRELIAKRAVTTTANGYSDKWPVNRRGPKGFEKYYEELARSIQWRPLAQRIVHADSSECIVEQDMEINLFTGKREELLPVQLHTKFDEAGLLTLYKITLLEQLSPLEMGAPEVPMGMNPDMMGQGADAQFNVPTSGMPSSMPGGGGMPQMGGGMPQGMPQGVPQGMPGGGRGGRGGPNVHVEL